MVQMDFSLCFSSDFEKALDKSQHDRLMCILRDDNVDTAHLQQIQVLKREQRAAIQASYETLWY